MYGENVDDTFVYRVAEYGWYADGQPSATAKRMMVMSVFPRVGNRVIPQQVMLYYRERDR
jgi:hypothetical protein